MSSSNEPSTKVTRIATDLYRSADAEAKRQSRSATQQIDFWARVGRSVCAQDSVSQHRVEAALAGTLPMSELTQEEGVAFNAIVSASIEEHLASTDYRKMLAEQGITTVYVNRDGNLVEYFPDGTTNIIAS